MTDDGSLDGLAAALRVDGGDLPRLGQLLADYLATILPGRARLERGSGLLRRSETAERLEVDLGEHRYALELGKRSVTAHRRVVVGGIAIRNEELPLPAWLDALRASLAAEAETSTSAREALDRLTQLT